MSTCVEKLPHHTSTCNSSDGLQVFENDDGKYTGYCFSCGTFIPDPYENKPKSYKPKRLKKSEEEIQKELWEISQYPIVDIPSRYLKAEYLEYYGYRVGLSCVDGETPSILYRPYMLEDEFKCYKAKLLDENVPKSKRTWAIGSLKEVDLFGWSQAIASGSNRLIITEGEEDAVALFQMITEENKNTQYENLIPAVVSLSSGATSSVKDLTKLSYKINQHFKEIVLAFDMDAVGQEWANKVVSEVFGNAKIAKLPAKDANQCLVEGRIKACVKAVLWKAIVPKNTRIVKGSALREAARIKPQWGMPWPFKRLTELTRGRRRGETIYFGAGVKMGKCFTPGTLVRMFDGSLKQIQHIRIGDKLLGRDSKSRNVRAIHSGYDNLFKITPISGMSYNVNSQHDIILKHTVDNTKERLFKPQELINNKLKNWKGFHTKVEYPEHITRMPPYDFGIWLGDGSRSDARVSLNKKDSIAILSKCNRVNAKVDKFKKNVVNGFFRGMNPYLKGFNRVKVIPREYLINSFKYRMELLAGWIDTDGYKQGNNQYEIITKDFELARTGYDLIRSLGLKVSITKVKKGITSKKFSDFYYRINISGDLRDCPIQVERKKCTTPPKKKSTLTGIKEVTPLGIGRYVGIEVDGDHTFLLADYTVVHNSELVDTIAKQVIVNDNLPCLIVKPEQSMSRTYKMLVGKAAGKIFHDPKIPFDEEAFDKAEPLIGDKALILDNYQFVNWDHLKQDIIYAVNVEDVHDIILDPITAFTSGMSSAEANEFLGEMTAELSSMALDKDFTSYIFCHLKAPDSGPPHERGGQVLSTQFAGSRAMMRSCNYMIGMEGNKDPDLDENERNMRTLVLLEDREYGEVGKVQLFWDKNTGLFNEVMV